MYILSCLLYDVIGGPNCRGDSNAGHGRGSFSVYAYDNDSILRAHHFAETYIATY